MTTNEDQLRALAHPGKVATIDGVAVKREALRYMVNGRPCYSVEDAARAIGHVKIARELLDGIEVAYGYPSDSERCTRSIDLPDGRRATLLVRADPHTSVGRWYDTNGKTDSHDDDTWGAFAWRGKDSLYGYPSERPKRLGFDGRARVFTGYGQGCERLDGSVWWQPPADVTEEAAAKIESDLRRYFAGDWEFVGLVVEIFANGESVGDDSVYGVEWGFPGDDGSNAVDLVVDLLGEAGIELPSTAGVARWARDLLESVARRVSGEDEGEDAYNRALTSVVGWWREEVEAEGDWDRYADPVVARIESDFAGARPDVVNTNAGAN